MSTYLCIDLKTFYASVECVERGLDPFKTNLVVADVSRGKGTICLAVSPKMKMLGVKNRCRLYEIPQNIKYIAARPRMSKYIEYSANIYEIYLKYFSKDDIYVYSIDEAFLDCTHYLKMYNLTALELAKTIMKDILDTYGITATCGIATNMYLAKVALDIMSKHSASNIGILDEERYKLLLWHHTPLTDFWQIGKGIEKRLNKHRIYDMEDITKTNPKVLYKEFGINAEILIDHAFGKEPCTIKDIKEYTPKSNSISTSQVLFEDYSFEKAKTILKEMVELKSLELVEKGLTTDTIYLYIGYSKDERAPSSARSKLFLRTNIYTDLVDSFMRLYEKIVFRDAWVRRIGIAFLNVDKKQYEQIDMFTDTSKKLKEEKLEKAVNSIKNSIGKNSVLRAVSLSKESTMIARNNMIGGHRC